MSGTEFTNDQFQQIYPDGIENHYWNHARNSILFRFLKRCRIDHEVILEIGGGRGVVAKFLHDKGVDITGVELADVKPVEGVEGYFLSGTDAFELPVETRMRFSMVLLLDVIEHIEDPAMFIEKIIRHFPNLKYILITVPARQELWTNYDEYNGHYRRYSLDDLKSMTIENLKFATGGYFNHILYPVFLLYAKFIKQRETRIKAPHRMMIAVHRALSWILQLDYYMLPEQWFGTSCIGLFRLTDSVRQFT